MSILKSCESRSKKQPRSGCPERGIVLIVRVVRWLDRLLLGSSLSYRFWYGLRLGNFEAAGLVLYRMFWSPLKFNLNLKQADQSLKNSSHAISPIFKISNRCSVCVCFSFRFRFDSRSLHVRLCLPCLAFGMGWKQL